MLLFGSSKKIIIWTSEQVLYFIYIHGILQLLFLVQGVYYYFYQIFRNKAEVASLERMKAGIGDGSVGMLSSLLVAAVSGFVYSVFFIWVSYYLHIHKKHLHFKLKKRDKVYKKVEERS